MERRVVAAQLVPVRPALRLFIITSFSLSLSLSLSFYLLILQPLLCGRESAPLHVCLLARATYSCLGVCCGVWMNISTPSVGHVPIRVSQSAGWAATRRHEGRASRVAGASRLLWQRVNERQQLLRMHDDDAAFS